MIPIRDLNPTRITPWVSWGFILVNVLVFLYQVMLGPEEQAFVLAWGLVPRRLVQEADPAAVATVFTSMFMHGGWLHILGNMWFLHIFGDNVEENLGPVRFVAFYLLAGVAAAATQILVDPSSHVPMVGASGAIAGVLAGYLVLFPRARVVALVPIFIFLQFMQIPAVVFIALWFVLQFFSGLGSLGAGGHGGVAYWAHIGGFVAGLVLVLLMRRPTESSVQQYHREDDDEPLGWRRPRPPRRPLDEGW
jgi:membrane associated rhomboid family serine protease